VWAVVALVVVVAARAVVGLPERCGDPTPAVLRRAAAEAVAWFDRNQLPDGTWRYRVDVDQGVDLGGYNWVRHAGVLLSLEQAAAAGLEAAGAVADAGRPPILSRLVRHGDRLALDDGGVLTTGGTALLAVALGERRLATGDPTNDERLRALGRFLRQQVEPDGSVSRTAAVATGAPERGLHSPFATGQVLFALARLERLFPGEGWGEPVAAISRYLAHERAAAEGYVPDASDHWAAYGLAEVTAWETGARLAPHELAFARKQMGIAGIQVRFDAQRTNGGLDRWLRGRTASGAGVGTLGEALAGWSVVAAAEPALAGQRGWLAERLTCVGGVLADRQLDADEAAATPWPEVARGAFTQFGITQMDDQQHPLSALLAAATVVADVDPLPRRTPVPEQAWLTALAAALALNPVRLVVRGPRGVGARGAVALGTGVAVVVLGLVAAAGGPLLRALDVSAATAVVAAGLAVAVGGLLAVGWPLRAEPAESGWRAGLVPVAVPLALRPELLLLALAAGAGGQGWAALAGVAVGAVLAVAGAGRRPAGEGARSGPGRVVADWAARLLAVGALAAGVALIVDGVYAV